MNQILTRSLMSLVLVSVTSLANADHGRFQNSDDYTDYARVVSVEPQYERLNTPKTICRTERVYDRGATYSSHDDNPSYAGAVIGGVAGALLGKQVGKGNGNKVAIAAGTLIGAIAGNSVDNNNRRVEPMSSRSGTVERCEQRDNWEEVLAGYQVTYEYGNRQYSAFMTEHPGRRVPVNVNVTLADNWPNKSRKHWRDDQDL